MNYQEYIEYRKSCTTKVEEHPCYSSKAHHRFGRVHLPVAKTCNVQCNYCVRKYDCSNENRPGVTTRVISPEEAVQVVREAVEEEPRIRVIGIAGPGDPLANEETLDTLMRTKEEFPTLTRCLSTNGLALPERMDELDRAWVQTLTITINAVDPEIGGKIYSFVKYKGKTYRGREGFEVLLRNQLEGLKEAVKRGMVVKVNSVLIPGINDYHMVDIAKRVRDLGAYTMNIIPLIPQGTFRHIPEPAPDEVQDLRDRLDAIIPQFSDCLRCRADAIGVPGEEGCSSNCMGEEPAMKLESRR